MGADGGGVKYRLKLSTASANVLWIRNLLMSKSGIIAIVLLMLRLDRSKLLRGAGRTLCILHHTIPCHTILCNNVLCYAEECRLDMT